jgi:hypothetical protein
MPTVNPDSLTLTFDPQGVYRVLHDALVHHHRARLDFLTDPAASPTELVHAYRASEAAGEPPSIAVGEDLGAGFCLLPSGFLPDNPHAYKAYAERVTPDGVPLHGELSSGSFVVPVLEMARRLSTSVEQVSIRFDLQTWDAELVVSHAQALTGSARF